MDNVSTWPTSLKFVPFISALVILSFPVNVVADPILTAAYPFSENTGSATADVSENTNTGTVDGAVWESSGKYGSALDFDGSDDFVDVGSFDIEDTASNPVDEMTITAWVKPNSEVEGHIIAKTTSNTNDDYYWMLGLIPSGGDYIVQVKLKTLDDTQTVSIEASQGDVPLDQWSHVALIYDGADAKLYLDGQEVGTASVIDYVDQSPTVPVTIGDSSVGGKAFDGLIDEVQIYSSALTSQELDDVMDNIPVTVIGSLPAVSIDLPFDEDVYSVSSSVLLDGSASDAEDGDISEDIVWNSDIDGSLGTGDSFSVSGLSLGTHEITASITDSDNNTVVDTIEIEIVPLEASVLGDWVSGISHTVESGSNRLLVFTAHVEHDDDITVNAVTYGGQSMTKVIEESIGSGSDNRAYTVVFVLNEAGIAAASGSTFPQAFLRVR